MAPVIALYDADCGLCDRCVTWLEQRATDVTFVTMQSQGEVNESLVVRAEQREWRAEQAVAILLRHCRARTWRIVGSVLGWWGIRHLAHPIYQWVARHRSRISERMGWRACRLPR